MEEKNQILAEFWSIGEHSVELSILNRDSKKIFLSKSFDGKIGFLYVVTKFGRYCLGEFYVNGDIAIRPKSYVFLESLEIDGDFTHYGSSIDRVSSKRVANILQRNSGILIDLKGNTKVSARTISLKPGNVSPFFLCILDSENIVADDRMVAVIYLAGSAFTFKVNIVDKIGKELAIEIPKLMHRITRRLLVRKDIPIQVNISIEQNKFNAEAVDFSYSGLCIKSNVLLSLKIFEEISIEIECGGEKISTCAIVIDHSKKGTHLVMCGAGITKLKERFYFLTKCFNQLFLLEEDPYLAWDCLDKFSYLELLDDGVLKGIKDRCITSWRGYQTSDFSFLPVLKKGGDYFGTYGVFKGGIGLWYHHALAIQVGSKTVQYASALYEAWSNYLASRFESEWVAAWYDPTKSWHNRFCQTFIKEHESHPECIFFDRHWFWISDVRAISEPKISKFSLCKRESISKQDEGKISAYLDKVYANLSNIKIFPKRDSIKGPYTELCRCILDNDEIIGCVFFIKSESDLNPFSVSNMAHIVLFNVEQKKSEGDLVEIVRVVITCLKDLNYVGASFTLDFDCEINSVVKFGFTYFTVLRYLSFSVRLMSDWISNNALNFEDLKGRISE